MLPNNRKYFFLYKTQNGQRSGGVARWARERRCKAEKEPIRPTQKLKFITATSLKRKVIALDWTELVCVAHIILTGHHFLVVGLNSLAASLALVWSFSTEMNEKIYSTEHTSEKLKKNRTQIESKRWYSVENSLCVYMVDSKSQSIWRRRESCN